MSTELPKEKKNYIIIEPTKITVAMFTILIGLVGWLGKTSYDKLTSIEADVKTLLIANSANKTNIDDLKDHMRDQDDDDDSPPVPVKKGSKTTASILEFILPKDTYMSLGEHRNI